MDCLIDKTSKDTFFAVFSGTYARRTGPFCGVKYRPRLPVDGSMSLVDIPCTALHEVECVGARPTGRFLSLTSLFSLVSSSVDTLEREEIKIVFLVEPAALEEL